MNENIFTVIFTKSGKNMVWKSITILHQCKYHNSLLNNSYPNSLIITFQMENSHKKYRKRKQHTHTDIHTHSTSTHAILSYSGAIHLLTVGHVSSCSELSFPDSFICHQVVSGCVEWFKAVLQFIDW